MKFGLFLIFLLLGYKLGKNFQWIFYASLVNLLKLCLQTFEWILIERICNFQMNVCWFLFMIFLLWIYWILFESSKVSWILYHSV
jgi:hypothetical protein